MKKYVFWGLVMSLLSACSNNVLNAEAPRAAQGQQDLESRPLAVSLPLSKIRITLKIISIIGLIRSYP